MPKSFRHRLRVRYNECDPLGVVFNANYLTYADIAITELWRQRLGGYSAFTDSGLEMAVVSAEVNYLEPLRFDDEIDLVISVDRLGETSVSTVVGVERDRQVAARIRLTYVCIDKESGEPREVPGAVRTGLESLD